MTPLIAMFGLSGGELLVVLAIVLILFGAKKIPDFAKGLGQGIKEFRKASREVQEELERATDEINRPLPPPSPKTPAQSVPQSGSDDSVAVASASDEAGNQPKDADQRKDTPA